MAVTAVFLALDSECGLDRVYAPFGDTMNDFTAETNWAVLA